MANNPKPAVTIKAKVKAKAALTVETKTNETVRLILEIMRRIPRHPLIISVEEVKKQIDQLGIKRGIRTFQRHLDMLSIHFDIERSTKNKPYGYRWRRGSNGFALPTMTEQESLLMALAKEHLSQLLPDSLMKSMEGFFDQAKYTLNLDQSRPQPDREWLSKVRVVSATQPLLPPQIKPGVFEEVSKALYLNHWLRLEYQNSSGKKSKVEIMPLGLAQQGPCLYLVARYSNGKGGVYEDERSLALHRILSAKASSESFTRPTFNLKKFDEDGQFGFGEGKRIRLTFRIDKGAGAHLLETPLSNDQHVNDLGSQYEISATVVETARLEWWLRGFGDAVEQIKKTEAFNVRQAEQFFLAWQGLAPLPVIIH